MGCFKEEKTSRNAHPTSFRIAFEEFAPHMDKDSEDIFNSQLSKETMSMWF
jgi:hypothetical protein